MAIIDVVKYDGGSDVFAWKFPSDELGTWTQLIVNQSQEAVLFKGGQALDIFPAGRHTLETANIPILNNIINLPFGGRSPFKAEVWYINKVHSLNIKWGTPTPIQIQDPKYNVFLPVRSFGQFGLQIQDSKLFLTKLVGILPVFDQGNITSYFKGLYLTKAKDAISSYLIEKKISVLEINAYLDEISTYIKGKINPTFESYGIKLINFYVNDINVPEEDSAVKRLKDALAKKAEMEIVGFDYAQERSFDTLEGAAKNASNGQGSLMGAGLGLGMGVNLGSAFGNQMGEMGKNLTTANKVKCPKCSAMINEKHRFCPECGFDFSSLKSKGEANSIICSNCNAKCSCNAKFCPECGNQLSKVCECGYVITGNKKFCPECGKKL